MNQVLIVLVYCALCGSIVRDLTEGGVLSTEIGSGPGEFQEVRVRGVWSQGVGVGKNIVRELEYELIGEWEVL